MLGNVYTGGVLNDGDHCKLKDIPVGKAISNIQPLNLVRGAGTCAFVISKKESSVGGHVEVRVKLPSKREVELDGNFTASLGRNDNVKHSLTNIGKAGANRWLGKRPTVKGNVMNAVDHPHGGNTKGGNPVPKTK